jgi:iron-sulfur cluster assembly protein
MSNAHEHTTQAQAPQKPRWISVTPKAREALERFLRQENKPGGYLRVSVKAGGCSGLSYDLAVDDVPMGECDVVADFGGGFRVVTDDKSFTHLIGMELDFSDGLNGKGFTFSNPNAKATCGCGSSFAT